MEDERNRYKATCSECGHIFYACKSLAQELMGLLDNGHGSCPKCNTFLNLTFDEVNHEMRTMKWDDYLKNKGAK